jgi:hypothetical protein
MEATVVQSLNPIQLHLLKLFQYTKDDESLNELKGVLFDFYCKKIEDEADRIWKEKSMSNEMMHDLKNAHFRTPYNK